MAGPPESLAGRVLDGRYRLDERIGRGGMGEVYRGRHLMMDRKVAVKVLRPDMADDATAARRFVREAKSTFRFDHQNCVRVTDFGASDGEILFLVMEYLDGRTVGEELHVDGPMAPRRVVHIARQVADALDCAHKLGFVHRDLKPENIMLVHKHDDPDFVKVLDFGLAKLLTNPDGTLTAAFSMSPLTRQGMVFGTPEYMSPEQASGQELSSGTDLYSLGIVMYEMLTGTLPFTSENFMMILTKHVRDAPVSPAAKRPDLPIPPALDELIMECLAKRPEERPESAPALSARLAELAGSLGRQHSRLPTNVSSSSTVDLDAHAVAAAANDPALADEPVAAPAPDHPSLPPGFTTAETVGLNSLGSAPVTPAAPSFDGPSSAAMVHLPSPTTSLMFPAQRRRRGLWLALACILVAGLTAAAVKLATRDSSSTSPRPIAKPVTSVEDAGAGVAVDVDAAVAVVPAVADAGTEASNPPGPDAAPAPAVDATLARYLKKARKAQSKRERLPQMINAEAAHKRAPKNLEARYLLGDAIVNSYRSTDPQFDRGCKYLYAARRLRKAKKAYREAGCKRTN